jgi:hypothetical protein
MAVLPFAAAAAGAELVAAAVRVFGGVGLHQLGWSAVRREQVRHRTHRPLDVIKERFVSGSTLAIL